MDEQLGMAVYEYGAAAIQRRLERLKGRRFVLFPVWRAKRLLKKLKRLRDLL